MLELILILCFLTAVASLLNLVIIYKLTVFLTRWRDQSQSQSREFFGDVVRAVEHVDPPAPEKTWDEKYEEELRERERRRLRDRGLMDLE